MANTLTVSAMPKTALTTLARSQTFATAVRLADVQQLVVESAAGPDFAAEHEPTQDLVAYPATDGVSYHLPQLRVADRGAGRRPGPDVWFVEDVDGVIGLRWTLEVTPVDGAQPLPFTVSSARLVWGSGAASHDFEPPVVELVESAVAGAALVRLHGAARVPDPVRVGEIELAMTGDSTCHLEVVLAYEYTVQVATGKPRGPRPRFPGRVVVDHRVDPAVVDSVSPHVVEPEPKVIDPRLLEQLVAPADGVRLSRFTTRATPMGGANSEEARVVTPLADRMTRARLMAEIVDGGVGVAELLRRRPPTRPDARRHSVTRTVPFRFDPTDDGNRLIFRVLHDAAVLGDGWQQLGDAGWLCDSELPNTIFRLPDALRLAWNAETAGPHMSPTLYRDDAGDPRVRLLLRLAPWQDPAKVVLARRGLELPGARVVTGEGASSVLHMGGAFPEELSLVGQAGMSVPLAGVELAFDVSLEFYEFVCQVVTRPGGLGGTVEVTLPGTIVTPSGGGDGTAGGAAGPDGSGAAPAPARAIPVPVTIRLDHVADLPCGLTVPDDAVNPRTATITNESGAEISIGGCEVTLVQGDDESVLPLDLYPARCTTTFPIVLAPGASADIAFEPADDVAAADGLWNGVVVELLDKRLTSTPDAVLRRVHELAPSAGTSRDLTITAPMFQAGGALPAQWASLVSIEVELTTSSGQVLRGVLSPSTPSRALRVPSTLAELVAGVGGGVATTAYRVRNNFADHQGEWSQPQSQSGEEIIVYPAPAPVPPSS